MIAGNYSPILDYYRGIGVRPEWQIVWSGWDWNATDVEARIVEARKIMFPCIGVPILPAGPTSNGSCWKPTSYSKTAGRNRSPLICISFFRHTDI